MICYIRFFLYICLEKTDYGAWKTWKTQGILFCRICKHPDWASDFDLHPPPAEETAHVKGVTCPTVATNKVYVAAKLNGKSIRCMLGSGCERSVIGRSLVPNRCWYDSHKGSSDPYVPMRTTRCVSSHCGDRGLYSATES